MVLVPLPNYPVVCDSKVGSGRNREEWADASSSSFSFSSTSLLIYSTIPPPPFEGNVRVCGQLGILISPTSPQWLNITSTPTYPI